MALDLFTGIEIGSNLSMKMLFDKQWEVEYLDVWEDIHSGVLKVFFSFLDAKKFRDTTDKSILSFNERWEDGTFICYETNPLNPFKGRIFCWPVGVDPESISIHSESE